MGPVVGGVGQEGGPAGGPAHGPGLCGEAAPLQTDPLAPGLIHIDSTVDIAKQSLSENETRRIL